MDTKQGSLAQKLEIGHFRNRDRKPGAPPDAPEITGLWGVDMIDEDDRVMDSLRIRGQRGAAIHGGAWMKPREVRDFVLRKCSLYGTGELYWGFRCYDVVDWTFRDSHFYNIGHSNELNYNGGPVGKWEGHAVYLNVNGDLRFRNCLFENLLGQAIQLVWRSSETVLPKPNYDRTIRISDVRAINTGQHAERGSYAISVFNPGHSVVMRNVVVRTKENFPVWINHRVPEPRQSRGAILVGGVSDRTPKLDAENLHIVMRHSDRPAIKLQSIDRIDIHGGSVEDKGDWFRESPAVIEIHHTCPSGSITGLEGNYHIVRRGPGPNDRELVADGTDYEWND